MSMIINSTTMSIDTAVSMEDNINLGVTNHSTTKNSILYSRYKITIELCKSSNDYYLLFLIINRLKILYKLMYHLEKI